MNEEREAKAKALLEQTRSVFESGTIVKYMGHALIKRASKDTQNPSDKWSLHNQILMLMQGTDDARGYNQWKAIGRQVKKGSKSIGIYGPAFKKDESKDETKLVGFFTIPVFRVEDTEGDPIESFDYSPSVLPPLHEVAQALNIPVSYVPTVDGFKVAGSFRYNAQTITLHTQDPIVFFHELAHAVHHRLGLLLDRSKPERECVAEVCAAVIAEAYGFEGSIDQAKAYVASHTGSALTKVFARMFKDIQQVLDEIFSIQKSVQNTQQEAA